MPISVAADIVLQITLAPPGAGSPETLDGRNRKRLRRKLGGVDRCSAAWRDDRRLKAIGAGLSLQIALEGPQDQRPRVEDAAGIGERNGFVGLEFERPPDRLGNGRELARRFVEYS